MCYSSFVALEQALYADAWTVLLIKPSELVDLEVHLEQVLLCSEALFKIWGVEPHELRERLEANPVAHILHAFLICDDVVIKGKQTGQFGNHEMPVTSSLHDRVVQKSEVVQGLYSGEALQTLPLLHHVVVEEEDPQGFKRGEHLLLGEVGDHVERQVELHKVLHPRKIV